MGLSASRALDAQETAAIERLQSQLRCQWDEERHLTLLMRLWAGLHTEGEPFERESWRWKKVSCMTDAREDACSTTPYNGLLFFDPTNTSTIIPLGGLPRPRPDHRLARRWRTGLAQPREVREGPAHDSQAPSS